MRVWNDKHRIRRCDETTGGAVQTIALCENSGIAITLLQPRVTIALLAVEAVKGCRDSAELREWQVNAIIDAVRKAVGVEA